MSRTEKVYGYTTKDLLVGTTPRKVQVFDNGAARWVTQRDGKLTMISGKATDSTFIANKDSDNEWIRNNFKAKRDRVNVPQSREELAEKQKALREDIRATCIAKYGENVEYEGEIRKMDYYRVDGFGAISYKSNRITGWNRGGLFIKSTAAD